MRVWTILGHRKSGMERNVNCTEETESVSISKECVWLLPKYDEWVCGWVCVRDLERTKRVKSQSKSERGTTQYRARWIGLKYPLLILFILSVSKYIVNSTFRSHSILSLHRFSLKSIRIYEIIDAVPLAWLNFGICNFAITMLRLRKLEILNIQGKRFNLLYAYFTFICKQMGRSSYKYDRNIVIYSIHRNKQKRSPPVPLLLIKSWCIFNRYWQ